ncbi:Clp protease N-terminal domain-containing protein [Gandjariella thermophila]|uniref:Clp R domain-containing protein n=1 Tax=Gandjariella thermophila TaxID=1931992 RepID=A0A4D4J1D6_9PSEU|nr:Clp protease N-terminal domain-containing protein [Gandjariella thermophila]GDY29224.1 hypothetical protein GTS_08570 [Gandjariella thermophila]
MSSPLDMNLGDLITRVEKANPQATALEQVSMAQLVADTLDNLGDQLVGHFVTRARESGATWSQIGDALGVSKQAVQQRWSPEVFRKYTPRARHAVVLAQERARARKHSYIGTEHLLLGLLGEPEGLAAQVLAGHVDSLAEIERAVDAAMPPGGETSPGKIPFTPRAKEALEQAHSRSTELGHDFVGTEHLLLGLFHDPGGVAARVLADLGFDYDTVRADVLAGIARLTGKD